MLSLDRYSPVVTVLSPFILLLFLLLNPLLLNPTLYGLLGVCVGFSGLILYLRRGRIDVSVLRTGCLLVGVSVVCTLFSGYVWNAFEFTYVLAFSTLILAGVPDDGDRIRSILFVGCLVLGLILAVGLVYQYGRQVKLFGWYGLARLPLVNLRNPNVLARYAGMIGFGLTVSATSRRQAYLGVPFFLLVVLSASKGAILALGVAGLFWLFRDGSLGVTRYQFLVFAAAMVGIVFVYILIFPASVSAVTAHQRIKLIWESLAMLLQRPLTGVGAWNFGLVYPSISLDGQWQRHPHLLPLWLLTSFGLVGTAGLVGAFLTTKGWSRRYLCSVPLVFVGIHEMVDTMLWIPGIFIFTMLLAVSEFRGTRRSARQSYLYLILCLVVVAAGLIVWKTDRDFKRGLQEFRSGNYQRARTYWWNDFAGFPIVHRAVAFAEEGRLSRAQQAMKRGMVANEYDAFYRWTLARMLKRSRRTRTARTYMNRYDEMDPRGMLTLHDEERTKTKGDHPSKKRDVSFLTLWFNQRKPRYWSPLVRQAIEENRLDLAHNQIRYLLALPKLTRRGRSRLLGYRETLIDRAGTKERYGPDRSISSTATDDTMLRRQFHYFFYRRPGSDYVSFGSFDQSYYDARTDP